VRGDLVVTVVAVAFERAHVEADHRVFDGVLERVLEVADLEHTLLEFALLLHRLHGLVHEKVLVFTGRVLHDFLLVFLLNDLEFCVRVVGVFVEVLVFLQLFDGDFVLVGRVVALVDFKSRGGAEDGLLFRDCILAVLQVVLANLLQLRLVLLLLLVLEQLLALLLEVGEVVFVLGIHALVGAVGCVSAALLRSGLLFAVFEFVVELAFALVEVLALLKPFDALLLDDVHALRLFLLEFVHFFLDFLPVGLGFTQQFLLLEKPFTDVVVQVLLRFAPGGSVAASAVAARNVSL